jgi:predicted HTH domain antitoxin
MKANIERIRLARIEYFQKKTVVHQRMHQIKSMKKNHHREHLKSLNITVDDEFGDEYEEENFTQEQAELQVQLYRCKALSLSEKILFGHQGLFCVCCSS